MSLVYVLYWKSPTYKKSRLPLVDADCCERTFGLEVAAYKSM